MNTIVRSSVFDEWLVELSDQKGKARIIARLVAAARGNFGDCRFVGDGISEMRVHVGPGYRVYFSQTDTTVYVLLCGGDKSTQKRDIEKAKIIAREYRDHMT